MTQAITDIKELVGEMPARGCECRIAGCDGTTHQHGCEHEAAWAVRVHGTAGTEHGYFVLDLCDECLGAAQRIKASLGACLVCGINGPLLVMPL